MPLGSITSPRAGDRAHRQNRNPRDITGREYQRLHAEADARKAAASVDIETVKRAEYERGFDAAFGPAFDAGVDWLRDQLVQAGVDVDAVLALDDEDDDAPGDDDEGGE